MEVGLGSYGATRNRYSNESTITFLRQLVAENPKADLAKLIKLYDEKAAEDADWRMAAVREAVTNEYRNMTLQLKKEKTREEKQQSVERTQKIVAQVKADIIKTVWINELMPNGKRMRFCTQDYMWKLGGAYRAVGKQGSKKLVGQVFDQNAVQEKFKGLTS